MKKTYIVPETEVFNMEVANLLAGSPDPKFGGPGSGVADAPLREEDIDEMLGLGDMNIQLW